MTFNVIASRVYEGNRKDGTRYHWCSVWIPLDDSFSRAALSVSSGVCCLAVDRRCFLWLLS